MFSGKRVVAICFLFIVCVFVLSGCHSVPGVVVGEIPIIMTMGSNTTDDGVFVVWEWRSHPSQEQVFVVSAEAFDDEGNIIAYSCDVICNRKFFIECDSGLVHKVRVVARQASGQWEACGGLLLLGEDR